MAMLNNQMVYFGKTMILLLFSGTRPKNLELKARPLSNFELSDPDPNTFGPVWQHTKYVVNQT